MNLPNKLTVIRVIMIPAFLLFYFVNITKYHMFIALAIFIIASLTDMLDGHLARKHNLVTNFGKLMDPLADKLLVTSAMVCVIAVSYNNMYSYNWRIFYIISLIVMLSRDLIVNSIRLVAASEGIVIAADVFGKIKTVTQMVWLCLAILQIAFVSLGSFAYISNILYYPTLILFFIMIFMTVFSGINYVAKNKSMFADA